MTNNTKRYPSRNVYGIAVIYFPPDGVSERLAEIAKHVDRLIVVDNSASMEVTSILTPACKQLDAQLISNSENLGIATALNQGIEVARAGSANWVIFFDQDSEPDGAFRTEFDRIWSEYDDPRTLGILGCNYFFDNDPCPRYPSQAQDGKRYVDATAVISSGSAYAMSMLSKLGPLKDGYFIDCVDTEYCWRARTNGYAVCITTEPLLSHVIGRPTTFRLLGRTLTTLNHSALRKYFIGRNNVLMFREYFWRLPTECLHLLGHVLRIAVKCVAEEEPAKKMSSLLLGIWHGLLGHEGKKP